MAIYAMLSGGLGNQMFQYAFARSLTLKNNTNLVLDTSHYQKYPDRKYELGCFSLDPSVTTTSEQPIFYNPDHAKNLFEQLQNLRQSYGGAYRLVAQYGFSFDLVGLVGVEGGDVGKFDGSALKAGDKSYVVGFWQNEKYFSDSTETIRGDFTFKKKATGLNAKLLEEISSNPKSVSVHVRRGDYITSLEASKTIGSLGKNYYVKAVETFKNKVGSPKFYVFSDEPEWCKSNLDLGRSAIFIDHNPPTKGWEDLRLMSACQHHIAANSSFSWWGAWLNPSANKIVIAPKVWFKDKTIDTTGVVPKDWLKL